LQDQAMNDISPTPTGTAATPTTEPEIVAGISSAEGQPAAFAFEAGADNDLRGLMLCGAAAVLGLVAGARLSRRHRRSA
jgi:hypothetical protein